MSDNSGKTVLICDDEAHIRESIRYAVSKEGYTYDMVSDGLSAYETAIANKPDLIILDVGMPEMTGFEVCAKIRKIDNMKKTKILILTAFGQSTDKNKAYQSGADDFMTKPFSPRELRAKICELLG